MLVWIAKFDLHHLKQSLMEPAKLVPWSFLLAHISPIAERVCDPIEGLKQLIAAIRSSSYDFETPAKKLVGDAYGIEQLLALYWIYDDAIDQPYAIVSHNEYAKFNFAKLKEEAVLASVSWVEQYLLNSAASPAR